MLVTLRQPRTTKNPYKVSSWEHMLIGISNTFSIKVLPNITRKTDYGTANDMVQIIYVNAATLPRTLCGVCHRHIKIIMRPNLYSTFY